MFFCGCTHLFYHLFYLMEDELLLNVDNEVHLFCIHYVFLPRILLMFADAWNNHGLSSMGYLTPIQLWISGLSRQPQTMQQTEVSCQ